MKPLSSLCSVALLMLSLGCNEEPLMLNQTQCTFEGSFNVQKDLKFQKVTEDAGEITLNTRDGIYYGTVHQAFGAFAGKLEVSAEKINFTDTLFFIYPANIIPPRVPRGKIHLYI